MADAKPGLVDPRKPQTANEGTTKTQPEPCLDKIRDAQAQDSLSRFERLAWSMYFKRKNLLAKAPSHRSDRKD